MATSDGFPVSCGAPSVWSLVMAPMRVPAPTLRGLSPPLVVVGEVAPAICWLIRSVKLTSSDRYPVVLALVMLLPITSRYVWLASIPDTADRRDCSIWNSFFWG